jgi:copper chaperone CopZ
MKNYLSATAFVAALGIAFLLSACSGGRDEPEVANTSTAVPAENVAASPEGRTPVELARVDFDVAGMDCGGCVIGTRAALRKLEGVQQADASYDDGTGKGTAWALYDPAKVTPERMMEAIRELGYTPTVADG